MLALDTIRIEMHTSRAQHVIRKCETSATQELMPGRDNGCVRNGSHTHLPGRVCLDRKVHHRVALSHQLFNVPRILPVICYGIALSLNARSMLFA